MSGGRDVGLNAFASSGGRFSFGVRMWGSAIRAELTAGLAGRNAYPNGITYNLQGNIRRRLAAQNSAVPEPMTVSVLGMRLLGAATRRRESGVEEPNETRNPKSETRNPVLSRSDSCCSEATRVLRKGTWFWALSALGEPFRDITRQLSELSLGVYYSVLLPLDRRRLFKHKRTTAQRSNRA